MDYFHVASNDTKTKTLKVGDGKPYETVVVVEVPPEAVGRYVNIVATAHANPKQKDQKELAWSTGVWLYDGTEKIKSLSRPRGQDLYKSQKAWDIHNAWFVMPEGLSNPKIKYEMRALNKRSGGSLKLSWAKMVMVVCGQAAAPA